MKTPESRAVRETRARLVEVSGRSSQDLGLGRIVGQVLSCVYLTPGEPSLEEIAAELGLSKAAVSIAARQLESMALLHRVWKGGDRKSYYRIPDHFGVALRQGVLGLVQNKLRSLEAELGRADEGLAAAPKGESDAAVKFLRKRVRRAMRLRDRAAKILGNPLVRLLAG
jgi:DNA-binding transcriptional regulator GbsR (MarR family)